jgi:cytidylate kinase
MALPPGRNEPRTTGSAPNRRLLIAIDGPAAAGKTTVARELADRAGAIFLDTGLLYRAITVVALRERIPLDDGDALTDLVRRLDLKIRPATVADGRPFDLLVDGEDLTPLLRAKEVDAAVSAVSAIPGVRAELLPVQRAMASTGRVVMVGRDIATVVAPDAELKIYLDASPEERARRRHAEIGSSRSYKDVLEDLVRRDAVDSSRETAPMAKAADAIVIETDGRGIEEIVAELVRLTETTWLNMTANGED